MWNIRKTPSFLVFLLFYYRRMDILRKNKDCRDFLDSLKFSMKTILLITYICYSLAAAGFASSTSVTMLLVTAAVMTVGESIGLTHIQTFISKLAPPHLLGRFYAVYGLHWDISRSIGPLAGGLFLTSFGGEVIFYTLAVCLLATGLCLTYTIERLEQKVIRKANE
ncbi:MFS transporter [Bacillus vallismortis]|uniref:MFS transporter n=1 Tax=Bacillus vallismortis TaxID=72361 RepID=UPI003B98470F